MTDNEFDSLNKDITDTVTIEGSGTKASGTTTAVQKDAGAGKKDTNLTTAPAAEQGDHPGIALLDIAIQESVHFCEKEGYPSPNLTLWHNFSRGFLNKSLWHYFPSGAEPESPAICALIGIAGLAVCYTPVIIAFYEKKQMENARAKQKQIEKENQKVSEIRADRRARGEDPNTGEPLRPQTPAPAHVQKPEIPKLPEPAPIIKQDRPTVPDWVMTTAPALAGKLSAAEPPAPGMG